MARFGGFFYGLNMNGMNRNDGKPLSGIDHIRQSVQDILSTPLMSRRMLPEYGSDLPSLIDNPQDRLTEIRVVMATAVALAMWEPRIRVDAVKAIQITPGKLSITIEATDIETMLPIILENVEI